MIDNNFDYFEDDDFLEPEPTITMRCIKCGYEEEMPAWLYGEFMECEGGNDDEPLGFQCAK